ncbi:MAG: nuclear transport factor 2 family protein [Sphingobium sp.]
MTVEEMLARGAIRATIAAYTAAGDRLREAELAACFTGDGVIETEGVAEMDSFRYEGREAIGAWIARWRDRTADDGPVHQATFVRHHLTTCHIELTGPDSARARTYWSAWTDIGPDHAGYYLDSFRREGAQWLITHRRIREDWRSSASLFTNAVAHSR